MSCAIDFIKYDPTLKKKIGKGAAIIIPYFRFLLANQSLGIQKDGRKWIYKTRDDIAEELEYSTKQITRIITRLKGIGILLSAKLSKNKRNQVNYYAIDEEKLTTILGDIKKKQNVLQKGQNVPMNNTKNVFNKSNKSNKSNNIIWNATHSEQPNTEQPKTNITTPTNTTCQDMLKIWNDIIGSEKEDAKANLSVKMCRYLVACFKRCFGSDMSQWKHFCKKIATSAWIMGDKFNLRLMSALNFSFIGRIKNGELGCGEVPVDVAVIKNEAKEHIEKMNEPQQCKSFREELLKIYGSTTYKSWFEKLRFFLNDEGKICFQTDRAFALDYIKNNFFTHFGSLKGEIVK